MAKSCVITQRRNIFHRTPLNCKPKKVNSGKKPYQHLQDPDVFLKPILGSYSNFYLQICPAGKKLLVEVHMVQVSRHGFLPSLANKCLENDAKRKPKSDPRDFLPTIPFWGSSQPYPLRYQSSWK